LTGDLVAVRPDRDSGGRFQRSSNYEIKSSLRAQTKPDHDPRAGRYRAGRWLAGRPRARVRVRADRQAQRQGVSAMSPDFMTTRRTAGQVRVMQARIAQAARQLTAACERLGPEEPWEFADPSGWIAASDAARTTPAARLAAR
jgi:hypothetical protein